MQKKISIGLVYYNGQEYLAKCMTSLFGQSMQNFEILFRDNSADNSGEKFLHQIYAEQITNKTLRIFSGTNLWHSGGHNFLTTKMSTEIFICGSIDMEYSYGFSKEIEDIFAKNKGIDVCTGKIMQANNREKIDSAGITVSFYGRGKDRGQGMTEDKFPDKEKIFGATGALFAIRKSSIPKEGLFNENIFYKNDVELMYRLQEESKTIFFIPSIWAFHERGVGENSKKSIFILESSFVGQYWIWKKHLQKSNYKYIIGGIFVFAQFMRLFLKNPSQSIKSLRNLKNKNNTVV